MNRGRGFHNRRSLIGSGPSPNIFATSNYGYGVTRGNLIGDWTLGTDGGLARISCASLSQASYVIFNAMSTASTTTYTYVLKYADTANPTTSYAYPTISFNWGSTWTTGAGTVTGYEIVMSRGTGEARGALWVQKNPGSTIVASTFLGTSGTTFTRNNKYTVTVVATGSPNRRFQISIQREVDGLWLQTNATWGSTQVVCFDVTDSTSPLSIVGHMGFRAYVTAANDFYFYSFKCDVINTHPTVFDRSQSTPIISKGATYNGIQCDALAAGVVAYNGAGTYAMTASVFTNSTNKWSSAFFTSTDCLNWTYVSGSIRVPAGADSMLGNGGLCWFNNAWYFIYNKYLPTQQTYLDSSTDLVNWTSVMNPLIPSSTPNADPSINVNPNNGKLEAWFMQNTVRTINMWDSPDGTTWTDNGAIVDDIGGRLGFANFGGPNVAYVGTTRYLVHDAAGVSGIRFTNMMHSVNADSTWVVDGPVFCANPNNSWESMQTFDSGIILADLNDGRGSVLRLLPYSGSDILAAGDATNSSFGIAHLRS